MWPLALETPLRFRIALDAHSVALDDVVVEERVFTWPLPAARCREGL